MNKRGISAVVATVLIILITVAGVTIIWGAIIPMIKDNLDFSVLEGRVYVVTSEGYTDYDSVNNLISVQIKRDMDDGVISRVDVVFSFDGNSIGSKVIAPDPGNTKVYAFNLSGYGEPDSISVAPIFVSKSGREKEGNVGPEVKATVGVVSENRSNIYRVGQDYTSDIPNRGLLVHYDFEDDSDDNSGYGNDGVIVGDVGFVEGIFGQAAEFDGSGDYITLDGINLYKDNNEWTLAFWIKGNSGTIFSEGDLVSGWTGDVPFLRFLPTSIAVVNSDWQTDFNHNLQTNLLDGTWKHVTVTHVKDSSIQVHINGALNSSDTYSLPAVGNHVELDSTTIGAFRRKISTGGFLNGKIDEFRIYNRVLSPEEIKSVARIS